MNYNLVKIKVQMFFIKLFGGLKPNNSKVNLKPTKYRFSFDDDMPPLFTIYSPEENFIIKDSVA